MKCAFHRSELAKEDEVSDGGQNRHVQEETDRENPEQSQFAFGLITHGLFPEPVGNRYSSEHQRSDGYQSGEDRAGEDQVPDPLPFLNFDKGFIL